PPSYAAAVLALAPAVAADLCLTGRLIDPREALALGVVSRIEDGRAALEEVANAPAAATAEGKRRILLHRRGSCAFELMAEAGDDVRARLSGLTSARAIVNGGRSVVVLEARDRVGGRMVRRPVIEGGWVDLGGQWIGPTQHRIAALAKQLSVKTFSWHHEGKT